MRRNWYILWSATQGFKRIKICVKSSFCTESTEILKYWKFKFKRGQTRAKSIRRYKTKQKKRHKNLETRKVKTVLFSHTHKNPKLTKKVHTIFIQTENYKNRIKETLHELCIQRQLKLFNEKIIKYENTFRDKKSCVDDYIV